MSWMEWKIRFEISFDCAPSDCTPPLNDQCVNATSLADGVLVQGTNSCSYANDPQTSCDPFASINGVWYVWNSGNNNAAVLNFNSESNPIEAAAVEPALAMFEGSCSLQTELFCEDVNIPIEDQIITELTPLTDYYFMVWTDSDENEGEFELTVTGEVGGCNSNEACNFNPEATFDDGSCDYSCFQDCEYFVCDLLNYTQLSNGDCFCYGCSNSEIVPYSICYDNNETITKTWQLNSNSLQSGVSLLIESGFVEAGWDTIEFFDGENNLAPSLGVFDGELTEVPIHSSGEFLTMELTSDGSGSCATNSYASLDFLVFCSSESIEGCTDSEAINFNLEATADDGSCNYSGCMDSVACNYQSLALSDDGSCCYGSCATIEINDTFGDGGGSLTIFDEDGLSPLGFFDLETGFSETWEICLPEGCLLFQAASDAFPEEVEIIVYDQNGTLFTEPIGGEDEVAYPTIVYTGPDVFPNPCIVYGCTCLGDPNYNPDATIDDGSCFTCAAQNNLPCGAIELEEGTSVLFDTELSNYTENLLCDDHPYPDVWYTFTPNNTGVYIILSDGLGLDAELGVWTAGFCDVFSDFVNLECSPSHDDLSQNFFEMLLYQDQTYYIQVGIAGTDLFQGTTGEVSVNYEGEIGCTDPLACTYNSLAAFLDESTCIYSEGECGDWNLGIGYYNQNCECDFNYNGDFNGDGEITSSDLTAFLSLMGQDTGPSLGDFNNTGDVTASDLTIFLSLFGQSVP